MASYSSCNRIDPAQQGRLRSATKRVLSARASLLAQVGLTLLLYTMPALIAMRGAVVADPDVWWHLRTGEWMIEHHAIPRTDSFTTFGFGHPWSAYSWLFELLLLSLFRPFGLYGIVLYTSVMVLGITVAVHRLVRHSVGDTPVCILLSFVVCYGMGHLYTPRPWLFSILLFAVELRALICFRESRQLRAVAVLPIVFACWANVHIQFVDGLIVLIFACADEVWTAARLQTTSKHARTLSVVTLLSIGATFLNPYGPHIYKIAHDLASQPGVLNSLQELQAVPFRDAVDWTILGLAAASLAKMARARRPSLFKIFLLLFAVFLAFRSQRDVWVLAVASAAILSDRDSLKKQRATQRLNRYEPLLVFASSVFMVLSGLCMDQTNSRLEKRLALALPARASSFVQRAGYPGPIFNDYGWGGYLIWSLHERVCIDGRASFQGDERISRSAATWAGASDWSKDPDLQSSNLVLGQRNAALSQLLRQSPDFRLLYEDDLAVVFVRRGVAVR